MSHREFSLPRLLLVVFALCLAPASFAQDEETKDPVFREFKGVRIGMSADECRAKLGSPTDKGDAQDFYAVSEKQIVQVFYTGGKVSAISVNFLDSTADAPTPKSVFGADIEAKADGSLYKMVRYPKAGYWLSYSRTAGDSPMVIITMQKIN
ncbi:MAG: hypothetical protein LC800_01440 [Acidobacteria bacterium]|nr:hypothetical protein [Acidobacteriota bacterium]